MIKNKKLFRNVQEELLWLINTDTGKYILGIKNREKIVEVFPNGWKFYLGRDSQKYYFQYEFFCYEKSAKILIPFLDYERVLREDFGPYLGRHLGIEEKYKRFLAYNNLEGHLFLEIPQVYLVDTDYFAGAGDGYISGPPNATWATTRDAADGDAIAYTTSPMFSRAAITGGTYKVTRGFLPTDTGGIVDTDNIDAAVLKLFGDGTATGNVDATTVNVIQTSQVQTDSLVLADYNNVTFTDGGSMNLADWNTTAYNSITLNATGLTYISKTGFTTIGALIGRDLNNSAPTGENIAEYYSSERALTTEDPKLTVTTTAAAGGTAARMSLLGVGA